MLVLTRSQLNPAEVALNRHSGQNDKSGVVAADRVKAFIKAAKSQSFGLVGQKSNQFGCGALLFRKLKAVYEPSNFHVLRVAKDDFGQWLDRLKSIFATNKDSQQPIWLIANDRFNGIVGMVNCLRLEPGGTNVRCILDLDHSLSETVDFQKSPYNEIGYLDLVFNVYQNGQWGSFRYLTLPARHETVDTQYAFLNIETRGDLSSFKWYESEHKHFHSILPADQVKDVVMCDVYCSSLNFKVTFHGDT